MRLSWPPVPIGLPPRPPPKRRPNTAEASAIALTPTPGTEKPSPSGRGLGEGFAHQVAADGTPLPEREGVADGEDSDVERGPLRRCLVTRQSGPRAHMLRFVLGPNRTVVPDLLAKLPGRGMWLSPRANVIEAAVKKGAFARAARGPVDVPEGLVALVEEGLTRRVIDLLGLARRAGQAIAGFEKARETVVRGKAGLVIQAIDGSVDEGRRLLSGAPELKVVRPLSAARLGTAFGRDHVVHVAVLPGRLAERIEADSARLVALGSKWVGEQDKRRHAGAASSDRTNQ